MLMLVEDDSSRRGKSKNENVLEHADEDQIERLETPARREPFAYLYTTWYIMHPRWQRCGADSSHLRPSVVLTPREATLDGEVVRQSQTPRTSQGSHQH